MTQSKMLPDTNTSGSADPATTTPVLRMVIPTGRIEENIVKLLAQIGIELGSRARSYRTSCSDQTVSVKFLKPQNIPELVALGRHDCGFTGHDWVVERGGEGVIELLDLGFDPVRIVAAVPESLAQQGLKQLGRPLVVASEYSQITQSYLQRQQLDGIYVRTYGATEALPPEDADMIVDNTSTGETLKKNRLVIIDELLNSSTRFICNAGSWQDPEKRRRLEELVMLMESTLRAKERVLLEMNVDAADLEKLVKNIPAMRAPTISELYQGGGYAVKVAVPTKDVPKLIPLLVSLGARDILEYKLEKIARG